MYDFEIQPYNAANKGDTSQWTPVMRDATDEGENAETPVGPFVTAAGLLPSSGYRLRVTARRGDQRSPTSAVSEVFTTGTCGFSIATL